MSKREDLQANAAVRGILPDALVTVVNVQWFGSEAVELTYEHFFRIRIPLPRALRHSE